MTDILKYMLPDQVWALSHHLIATEHPMYTTVIGNQIWYMKSDKGYPWDMNTFDDKFVYQSITEVSWDDPKTFKIFASKSWADFMHYPGANGGIVWAPRIVEDVSNKTGVVTLDSSYRQYSNCSQFQVKNLGASIFIDISEPTIVDLGGDLHEQECIIQRYYWGQNLANLEINHYAMSYGWVKWELYNLVNGLYVWKDGTIFNIVGNGGGITPKFPCGVPIIV